MSIIAKYRRLDSVINKLNDHILANKNSPYLPSIVGHVPPRTLRLNTTASEAKLRRESLQKFHKLPHFRIVDPSVWSNFFKALYPMRNSLSGLSANHEPSRLVNHDQLFQSYCSLPRPGVVHMEYDDLENFMREMFAYRAFLKPTSLSGTTILLFNDAYILKQYEAGNTLRQSHLNALWHITNDLELAKIPTSDYERRNMIYKTFFRDRQDVMDKIKTILKHGHPRDSAIAKTILQESQSPNFDFETYQDVFLRFGDAQDSETLNVLLLTALRHHNLEAYYDIVLKFRPENFTRNTFKILLENLAFLGKIEDYVHYLSLLISHHTNLIDIQLLNIIISSLVTLGELHLAIPLVKSLSLQGTVNLREEDLFLKLIKKIDKLKYSLYISAYDNLPKKLPMNYHPTEQTFLPLLRHYSETGAEFSKISWVLNQVESVKMLPLTSQMFKHIFRAFILHDYNFNDIQYMLSKLIDAHDLNSGARDTWVRQQIQDSSIPQDISRLLNELISEPQTPGFLTADNNFVKLSNILVRQVFLAYNRVLGRYPELIEKVQTIERDLNEDLANAKERHSARIARDNLEAVDLHEREELVYLKKTSLLKLLDISPSP